MVKFWLIAMFDKPLTVAEMRQYVRENADGLEVNTPDVLWLKNGVVLMRSMTHLDHYHVIENGHCTCPSWRIWEKNGKSSCGHTLYVERG